MRPAPDLGPSPATPPLIDDVPGPLGEHRAGRRQRNYGTAGRPAEPGGPDEAKGSDWPDSTGRAVPGIAPEPSGQILMSPLRRSGAGARTRRGTGDRCWEYCGYPPVTLSNWIAVSSWAEARAPTMTAPNGLMTVNLPSGGGEISRTHLKVSLDGWHVLVTDLEVHQRDTGEPAWPYFRTAAAGRSAAHPAGHVGHPGGRHRFPV